MVIGDQATPHTSLTLEGLNQIQLLPMQVRLIVEKLAKRCGFDEVEAAMPEGDTKLLTHIRKERARKDARRPGAGATEVRACSASAALPASGQSRVRNPAVYSLEIHQLAMMTITIFG